MILILLVVAAATAALVWPEPVAAQQRIYYQWEDKDGTVNFGDQPPPDARNIREFAPSNRPRTRDRDAAQQANEQMEKLTKDLKEQDRAEDAEDQIDTAKELIARQKELNQDRCNSLRANLSSYNQGGRVFSTDPETGERTYFSDDQVTQKRAAAEAEIRKNCQ